MSNPDLASRNDQAGQRIESQAEYQAKALEAQFSENAQHGVGIDRS